MIRNRLIFAVLATIAPSATLAQALHEATNNPDAAPAVGTTVSQPQAAPSAGGHASVPMVKPASAPQPLVCRSTPVVGSLIAQHKRCLTKAQWRYVDDANETEARRMMQESMNKPNCDANC